MSALTSLHGARALVTGASGLVGRALVRRLRTEGASVIAAVRDASPARRELEAMGGVEILGLRSWAPADVRAALEPVPVDVVFHIGAAGVKPSEQDPLLLVEGNVGVTTAVLCAVARHAPSRVLFAGSSSEYLPRPEPHRLVEDGPLGPTTLYGEAKLAAERVGAALARSLKVDFVTLRLFGVYGPGEAPHRYIPMVARGLMRGEELSLTAGEHKRDWIYVDDVADAFARAATSAGLDSGAAYNVCSGVPVEVRAVARAIARAAGKPDADLGLGRRPYRPDEPFFVVGDPTRFCRATGWTAATPLEQGVSRTVAWALQENQP